MPSSRSILGIDLRVASVKVAEIENNALKAWGMTEVPSQLLDRHPQLEDAKAEALRKIIRTNKINVREAIVVVGGNETFVKLVTLSQISRTEVAQAIRWKFAEEIPYPIEEALIDFYPLPKGDSISEKDDYIAVCINRKTYLDIQYILDKAGIKLAGITCLPCALEELFKEELSKNGGKIISVIYMGKRTTNISIFRHGTFEFNRELNMGGETITLAMSGMLISPEGKIEISAEEAEKIKIDYGIPIDMEKFPKIGNIPLNQLQAMVRPALEKIQSEISRTFEYYKGLTGEGAVNKIILTGGSSQTNSLNEFLSQGLGIPVVTPEPMPKFNPRLAGAVGAALAGTGKINLLPEEIKYRWKIFAQKFLNSRLLLIYFIIALSLFYSFAFLRASMLQNEMDRMSRKMEEYKPQLAQLDALQKILQDEEKRKSLILSYEGKKSKIPRVFEEVSRLIPQSALINVMNINQDDLHIWGTVFRRGDAAENILSRFVLALSASPVFDNVQLVQANKNDRFNTEAFDFEILAKVNPHAQNFGVGIKDN